MKKAILATKVGMTQIFNEDGVLTPVTVLQAGPCVVTQIKTVENDGYSAVQVGFVDKKERIVNRDKGGKKEVIHRHGVNKALKGHFDKAGVSCKRYVREFKLEGEYAVKDEIKADVFEAGDKVDATAIAKGKGFQGVVKRHGFAGVGGQTHGQHNRQRKPGSLGASSYPSRVFKGKRLPGQTGGDQVKVLNLRILKKLPENNLLLVKGSIPGAKGSYLLIED